MSKAPKNGQRMRAFQALSWMPGLSSSARQVGGILLAHVNNGTGQCDPGRDRLRILTGLAPDTIKKAVKELVAKRIISRELRDGKSTDYEFNWSKLDAIAIEFEAKVVLKTADLKIRSRGGQISPTEGDKNHLPEGDKNHPKPDEGNPMKNKAAVGCHHQPSLRQQSCSAMGDGDGDGDDRIKKDRAMVYGLRDILDRGEIIAGDDAVRVLELVMDRHETGGDDRLFHQAERLIIRIKKLQREAANVF